MQFTQCIVGDVFSRPDPYHGKRWVSSSTALSLIAANITDDVKMQARNKMKEWFGEEEYEDEVDATVDSEDDGFEEYEEVYDDNK